MKPDSEAAEYYREKWLEARKHLRAANKGAERNAMVAELITRRALQTTGQYEERIKALQQRIAELSLQPQAIDDFRK